MLRTPYQQAAHHLMHKKHDTPVVFYYVAHCIKRDALQMRTRKDWARLLGKYVAMPRSTEERHRWANYTTSGRWDCLEFHRCCASEYPHDASPDAQRGQIKQYARDARSRTEGYRWRGRSEQHVLTSGMDDYPRGPPHAGELHLDLISWMAFFTGTMKDIAEFVGETDDAVSFGEIEQAILNNIDDLHWSEEKQMYCDANVDDEDESHHVCHQGYLTMFPLLLALLPPSSPHGIPDAAVLNTSIGTHRLHADVHHLHLQPKTRFASTIAPGRCTDSSDSRATQKCALAYSSICCTTHQNPPLLHSLPTVPPLARRSSCPDCARSAFVVQLMWMDMLLHVAGLVANLQDGVYDTYQHPAQEKALHRFHSGWSNFADWINDTIGDINVRFTYRQSQRLFLEHFSRRLLLAHGKDATFVSSAHSTAKSLAEDVRKAIGVNGGVLPSAMGKKSILEEVPMLWTRKPGPQNKWIQTIPHFSLYLRTFLEPCLDKQHLPKDLLGDIFGWQ
ncbi:mannosyl oligosaccharide glucosidase-domain-containing protein [Mycena olivaceomarginata]|nr:mannosyl oligosaccharide glucosidase-domain-containing protein [Mycena olivaceomarginata]